MLANVKTHALATKILSDQLSRLAVAIGMIQVLRCVISKNSLAVLLVADLFHPVRAFSV